MSRATRRQVGGASAIWGGRCVPYDPVDFDRGSYMPGVEWPITYDEVASFHQRACDWLLSGEATFDAREISELGHRTLVPGLPDDGVLSSRLERWSLRTDLGREHAARVRDSDHVRLVTGLTCTEVVARKTGSGIDRLEARTLDRRSIRVKATSYVLACGGLETTRLLLNSYGRDRAGLGNHSGHLGRWYMGHVGGRIDGSPRSGSRLRRTKTIYARERDPAGVHVRRRLSFGREFLLERSFPTRSVGS